MKKVSVVMAYYNRKSLLLKTLESIQEYTDHDDFEIVIVDDASREEERLEDIVDTFDLDILLHRISPEEKTHLNPCVPYNKGFSLATGEVIVIQNPECFHYGDVISAASKMQEGEYLSYHCYSLDKKDTALIQEIKFKKGEELPIVLHQKPMSFDGDSGYYVHKVFRPDAMHFCTAITRDDLDKLGGFDERFAYGYAFDDREFFDRIRRLGLNIIHVEHPMSFHQNHYNESSKNHLSQPNNSHLYFSVTSRESIIHRAQ
jgi:glycosyltransferase involved in cell wall biosynthesis